LAYSGLALYESVVPGMPNYRSLLQLITNLQVPDQNKMEHYWPACANAAMAEITTKIFANATAENFALILELDSTNRKNYEALFQGDTIAKSINFGKQVADLVFEWSKTDGALGAVPPYTVPTGPGMWIPTPPAFAPPIASNWGYLRSLPDEVADQTQPGAPIAYSEDQSSEFYKMANEVYETSLKLSQQDSMLVKTWADLPGNFNGQTHLNKVLTQLLKEKNKNLEEASVAYLQHGIAIHDAAITCFQTKYTYNLIRPITYIRKVIGAANWNTVIPTPPHPEYSAAHATIAAASAVILESVFGENCAFTDHTHDALYGPFTYSTIEEFSNAAGWSRVLGGLHYKPSVDTGIVQGRKVGEMVKNIPIKF